MEYYEMWLKSIGWCYYYYYKQFKTKVIDYEDYKQECAIMFFKMAKKYNPYQCWCYTKVAYKRVMIRILYRTSESKIRHCGVNWSKLTDNTNIIEMLESELFSVNFTKNQKETANLIIAGYETKEIVEITGRSFDSIYTDVKNIKKKYAKFFKMGNYQRKHKRKFSRAKDNIEKLKVVGNFAKNKRSVNALNDKFEIVKTFDSIKSACEYYGTRNISVAILRKHKCRGYYWNYAD